LKTELTHNATSKPKNPKVENTYQPTKAQWSYLMFADLGISRFYQLSNLC
jgi:hypothetical protein